MRPIGFRRALVALELLWTTSVFAAPYAASLSHSAIAYPFAFVVYAIGSVVCHQRPERSFHLWLTQLPVCARCTGIYVGAACATFVGRTVARPIKVLALASIPAASTLVYEWTTGYASSNGIRFATGLVLGAVVMAIVLGEVNYTTVRAPAVQETQTQSGGLVLLCLAAWVVPGAAHLWLGRRSKGLVFLLALPLMFAIGIAIHGRLFPFDISDPLVCLEAIADLGIGAPYFLANAFGSGIGQLTASTYEYGNAFIIVAGLLNLLVIIDAYDVALGRK